VKFEELHVLHQFDHVLSCLSPELAVYRKGIIRPAYCLTLYVPDKTEIIEVPVPYLFA
jgi:hypothetical protein